MSAGDGAGDRVAGAGVALAATVAAAGPFEEPQAKQRTQSAVKNAAEAAFGNFTPTLSYAGPRRGGFFGL